MITFGNGHGGKPCNGQHNQNAAIRKVLINYVRGVLIFYILSVFWADLLKSLRPVSLFPCFPDKMRGVFYRVIVAESADTWYMEIRGRVQAVGVEAPSVLWNPASQKGSDS